MIKVRAGAGAALRMLLPARAAKASAISAAGQAVRVALTQYHQRQGGPHSERRGTWPPQSGGWWRGQLRAHGPVREGRAGSAQALCPPYKQCSASHLHMP